jgi:hypothetical protein
LLGEKQLAILQKIQVKRLMEQSQFHIFHSVFPLEQAHSEMQELSKE